MRKERYRGDVIGPIEGMKMEDYEELALESIREVFPEADSDCFSGRYSLSYWNDLTNICFTDKECSWEYPGVYYPGPLKITNEEFVKLLAEDGLSMLEGKRKKCL